MNMGIFGSRKLPEELQDLILMLFRVFAGLMMLPYGIAKIEDYERLSQNFYGDPLGIGHVPSLVLNIFAQVVCASTLTLGLFTRVSAFILAFNMMVATYYHWYDGLDKVTLPTLFMGMYLLLLLIGGGRYSIDSLLFKPKRRDGRSRYLG